MSVSTPFLYTSLLICALTFFACSSRSEKNGQNTRLSVFKGFPPEISGCSCYFSLSEKDFQRERFLFVSDLDSIAYVSINNKLVRLKMVKTTREANTMDERDYTDTYSNGIYTVAVTVRFKEHTGDEVWWNDGELKLYFKNVVVETIQFLGECGC